jgi:hypothetical protein
MKKNHNIIEIAGELRHEMEKAYLFFDGSKEVWIAKALCEWSEEERSCRWKNGWPCKRG